MDPKEIRIGNLTNFGKVIEINTVSFYVRDQEGTEVKSSWADVQPVKLTEDWLLKLGYSKISNSSFMVSGHGIWICNGLFMCDKNGIVLKYVHQLQNLHFALTNNELIIK